MKILLTKIRDCSETKNISTSCKAVAHTEITSPCKKVFIYLIWEELELRELNCDTKKFETMQMELVFNLQ